MIPFQYEHETYGISFRRDHTLIQAQTPEGIEEKLSKFPRTTVFLYKKSHNPKDRNFENAELLHAEGVGCFSADQFSKEKGRIFAMRKLSAKLSDKGFRAAVWQAYMRRGDESPRRKEIHHVLASNFYGVRPRTVPSQQAHRGACWV